MKKRLFLFSCFAVVFAFLLLNTLSAITEENTTKETELPPIISDLLSGKTTDLQSALSNLEEPDFPLALTASEILHHKALHQDIKTSPEAVEAFKASLQKRLETSQTISFKQTETCIQKIPAREIVIEGKRLTIPEHYLAPLKFAVTAFSPSGEAGTLLPDIQVSFTGGKAPIAAKILLDGKEISAKMVKNSFLYRPTLQADSILKIGTHKVEAILSDASNAIASASWSFTVGMEDGVALSTIPSDAVLVGSFSTSITSIAPGFPGKEEIGIFIFETQDGKRLLEYRVVDVSRKDSLVMKTTSLVFLHNFVTKGKHRDSVVILPKAGCVFDDEATRFSYVYSGTGKVTNNHWEAKEPLGYHTGTFETPAISWQVERWSHITLYLAAEYTPPTGSPYIVNFITEKDVTAMAFSSDHYYWRYYELADTEIGSEKLDGYREIKDIYAYRKKPLVEGESFSFPEGSKGRITVVRSHWKIVSGTAGAEVENPTAIKTNLTFSKFGSVELIHDIAVSYDWEDEHYEKVWQPDESSLYGRFPYKASAQFKQMPPGIILNTTRNFVFKTIDLEINGDKRHITGQSGQFLPLDPPIFLAKSELFPDSKPIKINAMIPVIIRKTAQSYEQLPYPTNFQVPLKYDGSVDLVNGEIPCRTYFLAGDAGKLKTKSDWDEFFEFARPLSDWFGVKGYPAPAELIDIAIDPQNPEINEDEKVDFSATIMPKPGLGSGSITAAGGALNLLDGYESQKIDSFEWESKLLPNVPAKREDNRLKFLFEPKQGSGSYEIKSKTVISVKDKETNSTAQVSGIATTTVTVKAGLSILYPGDGYVIPENQKFVLKTAPDQFPASSLEWKIDNQKVGTGFEVPILGLVPGEHTISLEVKNNSLPPVQAKIRIVEWRFSLSPESQVFLWPEKPFEREILGHSTIDGQDVSSDLKPITIGNATIAPMPMTLAWKSEPAEFIKCNPPEKLMATCIFTSSGRFEAIASHSIFITQPDGKKETYVSNEASSLLGAITGKAEYSFSFEPVRALVGMTREFSIGSITINIGNQKPIVVTEIPSEFSEPIEVVAPLLTQRPGIKTTKFDHFAGYANDESKSKRSSRETLPVHFKDDLALRIFWTPNLFFDNGQNVLLPETFRKIKPGKFSDEVGAKVVVEKPVVAINETTKIDYYFGPKDGEIVQQKELKLYGGDYKVNLNNVLWKLIQYKYPDEIPLPQQGPSITFSRSNPGLYILGGTGEFFVEPQEGQQFGFKEVLTPKGEMVNIKAKLLSWNVEKGRGDHLDGIATATAIGHFEKYYDNGFWIWRKKGPSEMAETQPLAVGCQSTVFLKADLSSRISEVDYQWKNHNGEIVEPSGKAKYEEGANIPTPYAIGPYSLELVLTGTDEISKIPDVFVVQKIIQNNFSQVFFDRCLKDSVTALTGKTINSSAKEIINSFYQWWWSDANGLSYAIEAYVTGNVILAGGGMCRGLGNYFFKCLEAQGLTNIKRVGYYLWDQKTPTKNSFSRSPFPSLPEYWGAIIVTDIGLHKNGGQPFLPSSGSSLYYTTPPHLLSNHSLILPPKTFSSPIVNFPSDIDQSTNKMNCYVFCAPEDGHAFVLASYGPNEIYLYDPSFGGGLIRHTEDLDSLIPSNDISLPIKIKFLDAPPVFADFFSYFSRSVAYLRGFFPVNLSSGLSNEVIDVPASQSNFLEVRFIRYISDED